MAENRSIADEETVKQWHKQLNEQTQEKEKTYYKDLDFSTLKEYYASFVVHYNAMERLLNTKAETRIEWEQIIKMRISTIKRIEALVDAMSFDWLESTASFSGSSTQRQEAYESIVDELKSAISEASPVTDDDKLHSFMFIMKHFGKWLLSECIPYSLGERTEATDPQRYALEKQKVIAEGGAKIMAKRGGIPLVRSLPFFRKKQQQQQAPEGEGMSES